MTPSKILVSKDCTGSAICKTPSLVPIPFSCRPSTPALKLHNRCTHISRNSKDRVSAALGGGSRRGRQPDGLPSYPWQQDADEWQWYDETISFVSQDGVFQICQQLWRESSEDDSILRPHRTPSPWYQASGNPRMNAGAGAGAGVPAKGAGGERGGAGAAAGWLAGGERGGTSSAPVLLREEDYMNPHQALCLAAIFSIRAFNSHDDSRLFCVEGFCRSASMLQDALQDTVTCVGGEVVHCQLSMAAGLHERLHLTVAVPLLFGVPPALDTLTQAIRLGGGIVDKTFHQWVLTK